MADKGHAQLVLLDGFQDEAERLVFFCSPAAAFVTGQVLYVDGGITASQ